MSALRRAKMKYTTLNEIKNFGPCQTGWRELLEGLKKAQPDDEPLPYSKILEINCIDDAIWSLRTDIKLAQAYAIACAEAVLPIFEGRYLGDDRPRQCIDAAKAFLAGDITIDVLRHRHAYGVAAGGAPAYAVDAVCSAHDAAAHDDAAEAADAADDTAIAAAYAYAYANTCADADIAQLEFKKKIFLEVVE